ncbi:signal transduction protein [Desulfuromonas versatilis]|uniref:Signal transduction protein n=1 Tax=Desulfuromonas versatilis TaxID=2802975 RepID=A0ABM8HZ25_9BACT|nr:TIGR04211 family SH3 domain-containing protein [Desulfuromonas versatilis]BCR05862.1 signal transduction protein [Desulfuromonas versatilis]
MKSIRGLAGLLLTTVLVTAAQAETRYVSDQLIITLRAGKGSEYQIVKTLKTDTPVEVLEEDREYVRVRTQEGAEGYVLKQYLSRDIPKTQVIARLEAEIAGLRGKIDDIEQRRTELASQFKDNRQSHAASESELQEQADALAQKLAQAETELQAVTGRYDELRSKSENVLQLAQEAERLEEENHRILAEVEQLRQENESLLRTGMLQWFLAGGGVFFVGWIAGKLSRKKKRGGF